MDLNLDGVPNLPPLPTWPAHVDLHFLLRQLSSWLNEEAEEGDTAIIAANVARLRARIQALVMHHRES